MALNIQKLLDAATAKIGVAAVDAADSARLASLTDFLNNHRDTETFSSLADLPTADSSNAGKIIRLAADSAGVYLDTGAVLYVSYRDQWKQVTFTDSAVVQPEPPTQAQGSNFGYVSGGGPPTIAGTTTVQKFSFTSDGNSTLVGNLTDARYNLCGQSSSVSGYSCGGTYPIHNVIDKFPFANDGSASDVGDMTVGKSGVVGQNSETFGYICGGDPGSVNIIQKFPFSVDENATDVGDLTVGRSVGTSQSSKTFGYVAGGGLSNIIDKFPFASDANATDVGDLTYDGNNRMGQNSATHGYASGGVGTTTIDKFSFATDGNASDVADLVDAQYGGAGQSSTVSGYASGRGNPIVKFPFATDANATDVGDLAASRTDRPAGQQY